MSRFVLGKCHFSLLYFGCQYVASFDLLHFVFIAFAFAKLFLLYFVCVFSIVYVCKISFCKVTIFIIDMTLR